MRRSASWREDDVRGWYRTIWSASRHHCRLRSRIDGSVESTLTRGESSSSYSVCGAMADGQRYTRQGHERSRERRGGEVPRICASRVNHVQWFDVTFTHILDVCSTFKDPAHKGSNYVHSVESRTEEAPRPRPSASRCLHRIAIQPSSIIAAPGMAGPAGAESPAPVLHTHVDFLSAGSSSRPHAPCAMSRKYCFAASTATWVERLLPVSERNWRSHTGSIARCRGSANCLSAKNTTE